VWARCQAFTCTCCWLIINSNISYGVIFVARTFSGVIPKRGSLGLIGSVSCWPYTFPLIGQGNVSVKNKNITHTHTHNHFTALWNLSSHCQNCIFILTVESDCNKAWISFKNFTSWWWISHWRGQEGDFYFVTETFYHRWQWNVTFVGHGRVGEFYFYKWVGTLSLNQGHQNSEGNIIRNRQLFLNIWIFLILVRLLEYCNKKCQFQGATL